MDRLDGRNQPTGHLRDCEHHLQVLLLGCTDDIQHQVGVEAFDSVDHAGEVARGVVETARTLLHDERERVAVTIREAGWKDHVGAVGFGQEPTGAQSLDHLRHQRLIDALAGEVVVGEPHPEQLVHRVEVLVGESDEQPPETSRVGVAGLQQHHALAGAVLEFVGSVELHAGLFVEAVEIAERQVFCGLFFSQIDEVFDEHAERCAPVADVVLPDHVVAEELHHPHQRVADHGRAQVADVHLLGNVGCRIVDDDVPDRRRRRHTQPIIHCNVRELRGEKRRREGHVDETRPRDLQVARHTIEHAGVDDRLCDVTRSTADLLGECQRSVDLCIGPIRRAHRGVRRLAAVQPGEDRFEEVRDRGERVRHGVHSLPDGTHRILVASAGRRLGDVDREHLEGSEPRGEETAESFEHG